MLLLWCCLLWTHTAQVACEVTLDQVPSSVTVYPGNKTLLDCTMPGMSSYTMSWYRQTHYGTKMEFLMQEHEPPTEHFEVTLSNSVSTFSLEISNLIFQDSGTYYCAAKDNNNQPAYFGQGTKLTVLENGLEITRPIVKVFPPSKEEICDRDIHKKRKSLSVTLVCVAKDFYPDHVSVIWKINGDDQSQKGAVGKVGTDNSATRDKNGKYYSITSRLRIPLKTWGNAKNTFTCRVDFYNGTHNDPEEASINGQLVPGMPDPDKPLKSAQTAKFAYGIFIAKSCVFGLFIFIFVKKMSRGAKDGKW